MPVKMRLLYMEVIILVLCAIVFQSTNCNQTKSLSALYLNSQREYPYTMTRYLTNLFEWTADTIQRNIITWDEGRTFGAVKRIQMAFIPLFYKLGVLGTMIGFLTLVSMKGLFVGLMILVLNLSTFLAKIQTSHSNSHWHGPPAPPSPPQVKTVHVHFHAGTGGYVPSTGNYYGSHSHPYATYEKPYGSSSTYENTDRLDGMYSDLMHQYQMENNDRGYIGHVIDRLSL